MNKWSIVASVLIIIAQIYLISVQPVNMWLTGIYDDALMVEEAYSILNGEWLGEYNALTLVKGPFTPAFMALASFLHIPFIMAQDLFFIGACVLLICVFKKFIKSDFEKVCVLVLMIFNPIVYSTELCRAYRDGVYLSLVIYLIAFSFAIFLKRNEKAKKLLIYCVGLGFTIGFLILCREESVWLAPYLVIFVVLTIIYIIKDINVLEKLKKSIMLIIPFLIALLLVILVMLLNYKYYGVFQLNQYWGKEFKEAYGAFTRIIPDERLSKVPVTTDALEKAYEVSSKCMELKEYFDRTIPMWAKLGDGVWNQVQGGYFHWALIRAVEHNGYYENAKMANDFYSELAQQINDACDIGMINGLEHKRVSNVIVFDFKDIYNSLLKCKDTIKYQYKMEDVEVINSPELYIGWNEILKERTDKFYEVTLSREITEDLYSTKSEKLRIKILDIIKIIYKKANPYVF